MKKIASFTIDHIKLQPGIYVSRKDYLGKEVITTFDIRMTSPNEEPVMNTAELHAMEEAALVSIVRIIVIGFMFGNLFSILYSLAGAALSLAVMTFMKNKSGFSILGISVAGGVSHNIGQLIIAGLITMTSGLIYYAPALLISGVITGLLIGTLTSEVLKRIHF